IKEYLALGNEEREAVLDFIRNCIKKEEERKKSQEIHIFKRIARGNQSENHLDPAEELEKIRMEKLEDPDM
ncbi:MAG: hypothetical protein K2H01_09315, partial [Ruminococcus sp.]|nr:hypothetical protein [Ruminococcus sp.]